MTFQHPTFLDLPAGTLDDVRDRDVVVFGASEATPYETGVASHSAGAPAAIRAASRSFARQVGQFDFDLGATLLAKDAERRTLGLDLGDVATSAQTPEDNRTAIFGATAEVLTRGGVPLLLGGDDSVPIPFAAAFEGYGPLTVVQLDAHVDWGDDVRGEPLGYGSPMRRLAELPWVTGMVQLGVRGLGSGEAWQIEDARNWGSLIVTSREWRRGGIEAALGDAGGRFLVSIDCDGIDPAAFPAVAMPTPGGPGYDDVVDLLHALARRGTIAGLVLAEYVPDRDDARRSSALIAARLATVALGLMRAPRG